MTSRSLPLKGKVIKVEPAEQAFIIQLDGPNNVPIRTVRALKAQGRFMGDVGRDMPRFVPQPPQGLTNAEGKLINVQIYLPPVDSRVFVVVVESEDGSMVVAAWAPEKWLHTAETLIQRRKVKEEQEAQQKALDVVNAMLDDFDEAADIPLVMANASQPSSDTVHMTADEGIQESTTIGAIAASKGTPFRAPRKGGRNGSATPQHQPQA